MVSLLGSLILQLLFCGLVGAAEQDISVVHFQGRLVNDLGEPIPGAQIQFWQTDANGNYNHPSSGSKANPSIDLVDWFQYFGTANTTDDDASFEFWTIRPGIYPGRPITHIHFKVWVDGQDALTSQFYFQDELGITQTYSELLQLELQEDSSTTVDIGNDSVLPVFSTSKTIVLDMGKGGSEAVTPSQTSGPYYPVVDFFGMDHNLFRGVNVTLEDGTMIVPVDDSGTFSTTVSPTVATTTSPIMETSPPPQPAGDSYSPYPTTSTPTSPFDDTNASSSKGSATSASALRGHNALATGTFFFVIFLFSSFQ